MSTLTGERCSNTELVLQAFDELTQHAVQLMCDHINEGEQVFHSHDNSPKKAEELRGHRNWNAALLNKLPVTCQRLRAVARNDPRYSAVMFYERTRLGAAASGHFLEGLVPGLPLFSGFTAVALSDDDLKKLKLRDVVADRIKTVSNLESMENGTARLTKLVEDYRLPDVPAGLPDRVHIFIARMRAICQGLKRVKPEKHMQTCKNCECQRLFYCGATNEVGGAGLSVPCQMDLCPNYWELTAGGPTIVYEQGEFCTWSCCMQWRKQLSNALPQNSADAMVPDVNCRKEGRARVPEALRKTAKRNETASRHMRTIEKEQRTFPAISKHDLKKHRAMVVRTLNVDLGMLYAATMMADSKTMSVNKVLPGAAEGWRSRPFFYAKALKEIGKLYDKHHTGSNIIANLLVHEPFLHKLRSKFGTLF